MKREELVRYDGEWYDANIVDCLLDEKDAEIASLNAENESLLQQNRELCRALHVMYSKEEYGKLQKEISALKAKLETVNELVKTSKDLYDHTIESLKASHYAEMVDAGMRERRLKRALYKACANWAHAEFLWARFIDFKFPETWYEMENKCLNKAELYK